MKQLDVVLGLVCRASHCLMRRAKPMRHPLTAGILLLTLVAQFGCASSGSDKRSASTLLFLLPREAFQGLGTVAVTSGRFAPTFDIVDIPVKITPHRVAVRKKGSVGGALKGGLHGFFMPLQLGAAGTPLILPIIAVLMPVGLVGGLLHGAGLLPVGKDEEQDVRGEAAAREKVEEREVRETTARELVASRRLQDNLRDRVVAIGGAMTPHTLVVLADQGPTAVDERPGYRLLLQEGIQTVLEVVVESVTLNDSGPWSTSSPLRMDMIVRIRLIRTVDDERIYLNWVKYKGGKTQTLEEWIGNAESLRDELDRTYTDIAERTVEEVFLRTESN